MDVSESKQKIELIKKHTPKSRVGKSSLKAFLSGGAITLGAELLRRAYLYLLKDGRLALTLVSLTLITLASLITAFGAFDRLARHTGAGTLVPITGFSNAVTSQAIDSRSEGMITGVGAKIFTVAGPVILYGLCAGVIYGAIYYLFRLI